MVLYHGGKDVVEFPEIRKALYHKDFYFGFYCTKLPEPGKTVGNTLWNIRSIELL